MKIYNETTLCFAHKAETWLKKILRDEVGVEVKRTRFLYQNYSYPIHIVIFESESKWGWFDPHTYQVGLNIQLIYGAKDQIIKDILRHEMAHYLCYIKTGEGGHGPAYQKICQDLGWSQLVSKASLDINQQETIYQFETKDRLLKKVQGLLRLAESENPHEAELATLKANQILLKHNLKNLDQEHWSLLSKTVLTAKKRNAKLASIYDILKHFLVSPVFIYGKKQVFLEVSGNRENIELADYVAQFLDQELEKLWKKQTKLKGMKAKNAFFAGIARGYEEKLYPLTTKHRKEIMIIQNQLNERMNKAHRRLSHTTHSQSRDAHAFLAGQKSGQGLTINSAIKNKSKLTLLNWSRK